VIRVNVGKQLVGYGDLVAILGLLLNGTLELGAWQVGIELVTLFDCMEARLLRAVTKADLNGTLSLLTDHLENSRLT